MNNENPSPDPVSQPPHVPGSVFVPGTSVQTDRLNSPLSMPDAQVSSIPQDFVQSQTMPASQPQRSSFANNESSFTHSSRSPSFDTKAYKPSHLIRILLITLIIAGGSIFAGVLLINNRDKPSKSSSGSSASPSRFSNWVPFNNQPGNFSARFPALPIALPHSSQSADGIAFTVDGFQSSNSDTAYVVTYTTYASNIELPADTSAALDNVVRTRVAQQQDGKLISSASKTISGYPAKIFQMSGVEDGTNLYTNGEVVLVDHVLYNVVVTHKKSQATDAQYFLDNFKIGANR